MWLSLLYDRRHLAYKSSCSAYTLPKHMPCLKLLKSSWADLQESLWRDGQEHDVIQHAIPALVERSGENSLVLLSWPKICIRECLLARLCIYHAHCFWKRTNTWRIPLADSQAQALCISKLDTIEWLTSKTHTVCCFLCFATSTIHGICHHALFAILRLQYNSFQLSQQTTWWADWNTMTWTAPILRLG